MITLCKKLLSAYRLVAQQNHPRKKIIAITLTDFLWLIDAVFVFSLTAQFLKNWRSRKCEPTIFSFFLFNLNLVEDICIFKN